MWITVLQLQTLFPIVLKGVEDSESRFIFVDIGAYGKQYDGGSFSAATVCRFSDDFESTLPKPVRIKGSGTEMPFFILGDEEYPLTTYLKKPFARKGSLCEEHVFNYSLSRARRCV